MSIRPTIALLIPVLLLSLSGVTQAQSQPDDAVRAIAAKISSGTAEEKIAAIDAAAAHFDKAAMLAPVLTEALASDNDDVQWHAARTLSGFGSAAEGAVPALTKMLDDETPMVRAYAALALGNIGDASKPAADKLVELFVDEDPLVRRAAADAIRKIKPDPEKTRKALASVFSHTDPAVVVPALETLAEQGEAIVPALCKALGDDETCYWAAVLAADMGPTAKAAAPFLAELLDKEDPETRLQAAVALGKIGEPSAEYGEAMATALASEKNESVQAALVYALVQSKAKVDIGPALDKAETTAGPLSKMLIEWARVKQDPKDEAQIKKAMETAVAALESKNKNLHPIAIKILVDIDAPVETSAPIVVKLVESADPQLIREMISTLASMGKPAAERVKRGLANEKLKFVAVATLRLMGPEAAVAVPELVDALRNENVRFRQEVLFALAAIGEPASPATQAVVTLMERTQDDRTKYIACYALGSFGANAKQANESLAALVKVDDPRTSFAASWALMKINPEDATLRENLLPKVIAAASSDLPIVRREAISLLGKIGGDSEEVKAVLTKALEDPNPEIAAAAKEALGKKE